MINIQTIRDLYNAHAVVWTQHCMERLGNRDISIDDVSACVNNGSIIEDYPDDYPHPSCLIFGLDLGKSFLHVVVGCDEKQVYIITAYHPTTEKFESDGKTRKE